MSRSGLIRVGGGVAAGGRYSFGHEELAAKASAVIAKQRASKGERNASAMRAALKESKGVGNFRNMFWYSPGGKPEGVKLIPISEVAAKDDFFISRT